MHAEALRESGLTVPQYARALHLPELRLRNESRRAERDPKYRNWRELIRKMSCPRGNPEAYLRYELRDGLCITAVAGSEHAADPATQEVALKSSPSRRQYSEQMKLAMVTESLESGQIVSQVARRYGVTAAMIFRWRKEFGLAQEKDDPVLLATAQVLDRPTRGRPKKVSPLVLKNLLPVPAGMTLIELPDSRRVYAPVDAKEDEVRQYIAQRETRSC